MARTLRPLTARSGLALAAALSLLPACPSPTTNDCSTVAVNRWTLSKASSWYLFADTIPAGMDPAYLTLSPKDFLDALTAPSRAAGKDRHFTYLTTQAATAQYFEAGKNLGYGIGLQVEGSTRLFVTQVLGADSALPLADQSPAFKAGFARGDELLAVAPSAAGLDAPAAQLAALLAADAATPGALDAALGAGVAGSTRWFRLKKVDGTLAEVSATIALYAIDPVPSAAAPVILSAGGKTVGYVQLRGFIGPAVAPLKATFAAFKAAGVTDLIVDVRYNGGGYLDVAGLFLDLMGQGLASQPMLGARFNAAHADQDWMWGFGGTDPAAIAPGRVAFITTGGSASASEVMPFALAPWMGADVAVVGARTYGKPVGQIVTSQPGCTASLFLLAFQLANRDGRAEYYQGLPDATFPGSSCAAADDLIHPLGSVDEASTKAALDWIVDPASCAGNPIPPAPALATLRRAPQAGAPEAAEPTLAQRYTPGLF